MKKYILGIIFVTSISTLLYSVWSTKHKEPYRIALLGSPIAKLSPHIYGSYHKETLLSQICARLTSVDDALNITGDIAKTWKISDDKLHYVFKLHQERKLPYNGQSLTANDIRTSLQRVVKQGREGKKKFHWTDSIDSIDINNDNEVVIILNNEEPNILYYLSHSSSCLVSANEPSVHIDSIEVPNSPGPYKVAKVGKNGIDLEINEHFRKIALEPKISVVFLDQEEAIRRFLLGEIDDLSFYLLNDNELSQIRSKARLLQAKIYWTWLLWFDPKSPNFKSNSQRRYIVNHFDSQPVWNAWGKHIIASSSVIPKGIEGFTPRATILTKDPILPKVSCKKPINLLAVEGIPNLNVVLPAIKQQLHKILPCDITTSTHKMGDFYNKIEDHEGDLYLAGWGSYSFDPVDFYGNFVNQNPIGIDTPNLSRLYNKIKKIKVDSRSMSDYQDLLSVFYGEAIGIPLGHPILTFAYHPNVRDAHMNPLGMHLNQWYKIGR